MKIKKVFLVTQNIEITNFDKHYNCYIVENQNTEYDCFCFSEIKSTKMKPFELHILPDGRKSFALNNL